MSCKNCTTPLEPDGLFVSSSILGFVSVTATSWPIGRAYCQLIDPVYFDKINRPVTALKAKVQEQH